MKKVKYFQHEPHCEPEKVIANLVSFVYDAPYLSAFGVFPPIHILNEILSEGGGDGGMGPGASWDPFKLTESEYDELWEMISKTSLSTISEKSRYKLVKYLRDPEFEDIQDRFEWMEKVGNKHRDRFFKEQSKANDL